MNLLILTETDRLGGDRYCLRDHRAEHIRSILKAGVGDTLAVGLLNGPVGEARIEKLDHKQAVVRVESVHERPSAPPQVDLICALPRPQTLKRVLFTAAMMGVNRLCLIRANRVEKSYFHSPLLDPENYRRFLIEGLSQGRRTQLPDVSVHDRFKRFFEDAFPDLNETQTTRSSVSLLPDAEATDRLPELLEKPTDHVWLAIGPEGGWVPFEIDMMVAAGFRRLTLGPWTLRVEHALTAALAQVELARASG